MNVDDKDPLCLQKNQQKQKIKQKRKQKTSSERKTMFIKAIQIVETKIIKTIISKNNTPEE